MSLLAIIPARGGSKRLPGKNIKSLGGKPLICWSIEAAISSGCFDRVMVSTDSPEIAEIALAAGAWVPGLRPVELSTDEAKSVDVVIHALEAFEATHCTPDGVVLLQPTSPFRTVGSICRAADLYRNFEFKRPLVSLSPCDVNPSWCFRVASSGMSPILGWDSVEHRSQELGEFWNLNGSIYIISPEMLRSMRRFLTPDAIPFLMDAPMEALDIDTVYDWLLAEQYLKV